MKRPLVYISFVAIMGVLVAKEKVSYCVLLMSVSFIVVLYLSIVKKKYGKSLLLLPLILLLFIGRTKSLASYPIDNKFDSSTEVQVKGLVESKNSKNCKVSVVVRTISIDIGTLEELKPTKVLVYLPEGVDVDIGAYILAKGELVKLQEPTNDGQFNEVIYYKAKGIWYKLYADECNVLLVKDINTKKSLMSIRDNIAQKFDEMYDQEKSGIIKGILLGDKNQISEEIKDLYKENGIAHLLAISGLHVSIIGYSLYKLLLRFRVPLKSSTTISIVLLLIYSVLTGSSTSTIRAVIMLSLMILANVLQRTYDTLSAISLAATIIIFINPYQLYDSSFILSFSAVLSIVLIPTKVYQIYKPKSKIIKSLIASFSVTLGALPITAYLFYEIPVYSTILNLIVIPLMSLLMPVIICSLLCNPISSIACAPFVFIAEGILDLYEILCNFFIHLPFSKVVVGKPSLWSVIVYYAALFFILYKKDWKKAKITVVLVLSTISIILVPINSRKLDITFIDVGQGLSIFMKKGSNTYLIDGGGKFNSDIAKYTLIPFIRSRGVATLDYVFVTHGDMDHIKGVRELIGKVEIGHLIVSSLEEQPTDSIVLIEEAKKYGIDIIYFKKGDLIKDGEVFIRCLYPNENQVVSSNNEGSLTLEITYLDFDLLICGDIHKKQELELLPYLKEYEVLQVPHHGSKSSSSEDFVSTTNPENAIISAGKNNVYGHPNKNVVEIYKFNNTKIYNTAINGMIRILTNGRTYEIIAKVK
ncbi:MAG: putative rane protein [Clostridiales bacterium]|jgi:competence protein ComEC|nr:putative rane protein [Clostridiales bacterium]